jgi:uncharacterized membrane protein YbhN (UPF0104 family)
VLRLAIAAAILAFVLHKVPISQVVDALASANGFYFFAALVTVLVARVVDAHRLRILAAAQRMVVPLGTAVHINLASVFYTLFVPGGTLAGGAARLIKLSAVAGRPAASLVTVFRDRWDATLTLALVGLAFLALDPTDGELSAWTVLLATLVATVFLYVVVFVPVITRWGHALPRVPLLERKLTGLRDTLRQTGRMPVSTHIRAFATSIVSHAGGVLFYWMLAQSLDLEVSLVTIGWVRSAVVLISMVPVSLGGIGLREAAFLYFLTPYGIGSEQAVAYSFLVFVVAVFFTGLLGGILECRTWLSTRAPEEMEQGSS